MSITGTAAIFVACAAFALLLARLLYTIDWRRWRTVGHATEIDLASLYIFVSARQLRLITGVLLAATTAIAMAFQMPWQALVLALVATAVLPRFVVRWLQQRRRERLLAQLPDALTQWAGLLTAGQGLAYALGQVAARQAVPLRDDLTMILKQHRVGMPIETAVEEWRTRTGIGDLAMVSTLLRTTRELGGNLAESMARLAEVMRSRLAMEARIRALTSQGKLQGLIVGLLPLLLLIVLGFMEPEAMARLYQTPTGWAALGTIVVLEVTGYILIRRIVSIEV
jgi:tight adherence protein B